MSQMGQISCLKNAKDGFSTYAVPERTRFLMNNGSFKKGIKYTKRHKMNIVIKMNKNGTNYPMYKKKY